MHTNCFKFPNLTSLPPPNLPLYSSPNSSLCPPPNSPLYPSPNSPPNSPSYPPPNSLSYPPPKPQLHPPPNSPSYPPPKPQLYPWLNSPSYPPPKPQLYPPPNSPSYPPPNSPSYPPPNSPSYPPPKPQLYPPTETSLFPPPKLTSCPPPVFSQPPPSNRPQLPPKCIPPQIINNYSSPFLVPPPPRQDVSFTSKPPSLPRPPMNIRSLSNANNCDKVRYKKSNGSITVRGKRDQSFNKNQAKHPLPNQFFCDGCVRSFTTHKTFNKHIAEHIKCEVDGCEYTAAPSVMAEHKAALHPDFKNIFTDESQLAEVNQWREGRKKNYPSIERNRNSMRDRKKLKLHEANTDGHVLRNNIIETAPNHITGNHVSTKCGFMRTGEKRIDMAEQAEFRDGNHIESEKSVAVKSCAVRELVHHNSSDDISNLNADADADNYGHITEESNSKTENSVSNKSEVMKAEEKHVVCNSDYFKNEDSGPVESCRVQELVHDNNTIDNPIFDTHDDNDSNISEDILYATNAEDVQQAIARTMREVENTINQKAKCSSDSLFAGGDISSESKNKTRKRKRGYRHCDRDGHHIFAAVNDHQRDSFSSSSYHSQHDSIKVQSKKMANKSPLVNRRNTDFFLEMIRSERASSNYSTRRSDNNVPSEAVKNDNTGAAMLTENHKAGPNVCPVDGALKLSPHPIDIPNKVFEKDKQVMHGRLLQCI